MIVLAILGGLLLVAGLGLMLWGGIWLLILVFQASVLWGLSLFVPLVGLVSYIIFIVTRWEQSKKPFLISLGGSVLFILGVVLFAIGAPGTLSPDPGSTDDPFASDEWGDWENETNDDGLFTQPTLTPTMFQPSPTQLNLSPIPTRTPKLPSPTPRPSPTPMRTDQARSYIGERLIFHIDDGTTFVGRLVAIEGSTLRIERQIGGGMMEMPIAMSRVRGVEPLF